MARPGAVSKIVVRRLGGTLLTEDGLRLWTSVASIPETESFRLGEEVVVFLVHTADGHAFNFASGEFGAYRIVEGIVTLMTKAAAFHRGDRPVEAAAFFRELLRSRSVVGTRK